MASRQQLSDACRAVGVAHSGNKDDLLERLLGDQTVLDAIVGATAAQSSSVAKTTSTSKKEKKEKKEKKSASDAGVKKAIEKRAPNAYQQFCNENRAAVVAAGVKDPKDVMKKLAEMWGKGNVTTSAPGLLLGGATAPAAVPAVDATLPTVNNLPPNCLVSKMPLNMPGLVSLGKVNFAGAAHEMYISSSVAVAIAPPAALPPAASVASSVAPISVATAAVFSPRQCNFSCGCGAMLKFTVTTDPSKPCNVQTTCGNCQASHKILVQGSK